MQHHCYIYAFIETKKKKEYCYDNSIPLITIKYNENISDKLEHLI